MLREKIIAAIEAVGFDEYREIEATELIFSEDVFASCKANTCGNYGKNHSCPPLSGDMQKNRNRFTAYKQAIILNKIMFLGNYYEKIEACGHTVAHLLNCLREILSDEPVLIAGPGGCDHCDPCAAKTDEPCHFPDQKRYSMEGSGMDIVTLSRRLNMTYNGGDKKVGFFMVVMY